MKSKACLKYCGGCRSRYNRNAVAHYLETALAGLVEWCDARCDNPDLVLLLQGCEVNCVDTETYRPARVVLVTGHENAEEFVRAMLRRGLQHLDDPLLEFLEQHPGVLPVEVKEHGEYADPLLEGHGGHG